MLAVTASTEHAVLTARPNGKKLRSTEAPSMLPCNEPPVEVAMTRIGVEKMTVAPVDEAVAAAWIRRKPGIEVATVPVDVA